jgi:hypothetical protein
MITTSSTVPILTSANWLATAPNSYTFPAGTIEGAYTLYAWAKDAAGYISPASRKDIEIDMTKPTTPLIPTILPQTGVFEVSTTAIETNVSSLSVKVTCTPGDLPKVHYGLGLTVSSTEVCPASKNVTLSIPL